VGWKIVRHSFVLLFNNLGNALKVSIGPYLIGIALSIAAFLAAGLPLRVLETLASNPGMTYQIRDAPGPFILAVLAVLVLIMFVSAWVAVSWHRFVLLEDYPGIIPAISGRPIWGYLGRVVLLIIILILIAIPTGIVAGLVSAPFVSQNPGTGALVALLIIGTLVAAFLSWVWLRLGLILPAAAVGKPMGMGESWSATARISGAIFVAALIMFAISGVVSFLLASVFGEGTAGTILGLIVNWISVMVGISVLTTLYGHLVEDREMT
jgi:hypothetical protein